MNGANTKPLHPRLTAARPDLAAAALRGRVVAARYADGERRHVLRETLDLKRHPRQESSVDTQLLFGESVMLYEEEEGWAWVQAERDGYVGYVASCELGRASPLPTHRVVVNRTFVYPAPDMKRPIAGAVPLDGRLAVEGIEGQFAKVGALGYVIASHLSPLERPAADYVAVAEQLRGAPYLWGGRSVGGIDCSGLVQLAMSVADKEMPRDTELQEQAGDAVPIDEALSGLRRGDLVFWKGHVGILTDATQMLHANGHHMLVIQEPLRAAQQRIESVAGLPISSIRRVGK